MLLELGQLSIDDLHHPARSHECVPFGEREQTEDLLGGWKQLLAYVTGSVHVAQVLIVYGSRLPLGGERQGFALILRDQLSTVHDEPVHS